MLCEFKSIILSNEGTNKDNGYRVLRVTIIEPDQNTTKGDIITIFGNYLPTVTKSRFYVVGDWEENPHYGKQFHVTEYEEIMPSNYRDIIAYLSSGRIDGITPSLAELIYKVFRNNTISVLDEDVKRLEMVPGISAMKCKQIMISYEYERCIKKIIVRYKSYNITENVLRKVYKIHKANTINVIEQNPYMLFDYGVDLEKIDRLAKKLNFDSDHTGRTEAIIKNVILVHESSGNVCMRLEAYERKVLIAAKNDQISKDMLARAEDSLIKKGDIVYTDKFVFRKEMFEIENDIAKEVIRIMRSFRSFDLDIKEEIKKAEAVLCCRLHEIQKKAVEFAINNGVCIINGGPGTGKTMVIKVIRYIYDNVIKKNMLFLAPTGRAASRMRESSGYTAYTIHSNRKITTESLLEKSGDTISEDAIACDEASMIDMFLFRKLVWSIDSGKQLILIGDVNQLPSIGPGTILRDMINSEVIPVVTLTKVFRQSTMSNIYLNCQKIVKGNLSLEYGGDFTLINAYNFKECADLMVDAYLHESKEYGIKEVCCLCLLKNKTEASVKAMNLKIQNAVNPYSIEKNEIFHGGLLREADRVMNIVNDTEKFLANGDLGIIKKIHNDTVTVIFDDGKEIIYQYDELCKLELAYAMTIHKAQGSEFKSVITSMIEENGNMLQMNLFNTVVSRAKEQFTLIGTEKACKIAICSHDLEERDTMLKEKLIICNKKNRAA